MVGTLIQGNTVQASTGPNILLRDNEYGQVVDNYSTGNTGNGGNYGGGILVADQTDVSNRIVIKGNRCKDNAGAGIRIAPDTTLVGQHFIIEGNFCEGNGNHGVLVDNGPGTVVSGNYCLDNTGAGIRLEPLPATGQGDMAATGNVCANNSTYGISCFAESVTITGNRCFDDDAGTQTHGLRIEGTQANYLVVMGNNFLDNATAAISDDGLGTGHVKLNNKGMAGGIVTDNGAFNVSVAANFDVGAKLDLTASDASGRLGLIEQSGDPAALAQWGYLYCKDDGASKTQLRVRFGTGSAVVLATEGAAGSPSHITSIPIGAVAYNALGTNTTVAAADRLYFINLWMPISKSLTGAAVLNGATVGTDKWCYYLANNAGTVVAQSAAAGVTTSGANAFQEIAFTAPYTVAGQSNYWLIIQGNSNTDTLRTVAASTYKCFTGIKTAAAAFGAETSITAPTTFTADLGPIGYVY